MENLLFYRDLKDFSFVFITGASRVGKTSLANFVSQHPQLEFLDEPWEMLMFPFLIDESQNKLLSTFFQAMLHELANEILLYRRANLRFNDASSLWKSKQPNLIYTRLLEQKSRAQVRDSVLNNKTKILLSLPETTPFIQFFFDHIPNLHVINITRNGFSVAREITQKGWFSTHQLQTPQNSQPFYKTNLNGQTYYLPWWVNPDDSHTFISITDFERGLWYWHYFVASAQEQEIKLSPLQQEKLIHLDSDLIFNNSQEVAQQLISFLDLEEYKLSSYLKKIASSSDNHINEIKWSTSMPTKKCQEIEFFLRKYTSRTVTPC